MILHIKKTCPKCNGEANADSTACCIRCLGKGEVDIWIHSVLGYEEQED